MPKPIYWKYSKLNSDGSFDPKLRKATSMMKMVLQGLEEVAQRIPIIEFGERTVPAFLGSMHGEIEPTLNYLKGLAQSQRARPFLFQNSLHHSTVGFASQYFPWIGASYSLCCIRQSQMEILRAGLLQTKSDESLLLIHTESFPEDLAEISSYPKQNLCEILFLDPGSANLLRPMTHISNFKSAIEHLMASGQVCELR